MTPPDGQAGSGNDDRVLAAIDRLDERLRKFQDQIADRFEGLGDRFMPRAELLNRLSEFEGLHTDVARLEDAINTAEQRRLSDRRWAIGALLSSAAPLLALFAIILTHWK